MLSVPSRLNAWSEAGANSFLSVTICLLAACGKLSESDDASNSSTTEAEDSSSTEQSVSGDTSAATQMSSDDDADSGASDSTGAMADSCPGSVELGWEATIAGLDPNVVIGGRGVDIDVASDGAVWIAGTKERDIWFGRLSWSGDLEWEETHDGPGNVEHFPGSDNYDDQGIAIVGSATGAWVIGNEAIDDWQHRAWVGSVDLDGTVLDEYVVEPADGGSEEAWDGARLGEDGLIVGRHSGLSVFAPDGLALEEQMPSGVSELLGAADGYALWGDGRVQRRNATHETLWAYETSFGRLAALDDTGVVVVRRAGADLEALAIGDSGVGIGEQIWSANAGEDDVTRLAGAISVGASVIVLGGRDVLEESGPDEVSAWCILPDGTFEPFALPASEGQAESIVYNGDGRLVIAVLVANDRGDGYDLLVTAFDI